MEKIETNNLLALANEMRATEARKLCEHADELTKISAGFAGHWLNRWESGVVTTDKKTGEQINFYRDAVRPSEREEIELIFRAELVRYCPHSLTNKASKFSAYKAAAKLARRHLYRCNRAKEKDSILTVSLEAVQAAGTLDSLQNCDFWQLTAREEEQQSDCEDYSITLNALDAYWHAQAGCNRKWKSCLWQDRETAHLAWQALRVGSHVLDKLRGTEHSEFRANNALRIRLTKLAARVRQGEHLLNDMDSPQWLTFLESN